jgi:hypothetical protein
MLFKALGGEIKPAGMIGRQTMMLLIEQAALNTLFQVFAVL